MSSLNISEMWSRIIFYQLNTSSIVKLCVMSLSCIHCTTLWCEQWYPIKINIKGRITHGDTVNVLSGVSVSFIFHDIMLRSILASTYPQSNLLAHLCLKRVTDAVMFLQPPNCCCVDKLLNHKSLIEVINNWISNWPINEKHYQ